MIKIITIIGARPQFIKAAAVSRQIKNYPDIQEKIIHTGQHFDKNMSDIFFEEMDIPKPDYNLNINGLSHGAMTGQMIEGVEKILLDETPDYVLVYGDTNSTLAGALAAKKLHIKVVHVEAGLRSFNMTMPEEINRILTDRISDILFCPTNTAIKNLHNEGFENFDSKIVYSGDVMYDAAMYYAEKSEKISDIISRLKLEKGNYILGTIHRAENTDNLLNLQNIIEALNEQSKLYRIIVPLHPRTRKIIAARNLHPAFTIIDPVGYFDMIQLIKNSALVITDSGGLQKEAFFFDKYCITLREQTEWTELVENNFNSLVGTDTAKIIDAINKNFGKTLNQKPNLYGMGEASKIICTNLLS
jgi:UDP-GlcNAc3NAcA epimerase